MFGSLFKFFGVCLLIGGILLGIGYVTGQAQAALDAIGFDLPTSKTEFVEQAGRLEQAVKPGFLDNHFNSLGK